MANAILIVKLSFEKCRAGKSQKDKAESHDRIVQVAAARFRQAGIDGIGVADPTKDAGMTHGGFIGTLLRAMSWGPKGSSVL